MSDSDGSTHTNDSPHSAVPVLSASRYYATRQLAGAQFNSGRIVSGTNSAIPVLKSQNNRPEVIAVSDRSTDSGEESHTATSDNPQGKFLTRGKFGYSDVDLSTLSITHSTNWRKAYSPVPSIIGVHGVHRDHNFVEPPLPLHPNLRHYHVETHNTSYKNQRVQSSHHSSNIENEGPVGGYRFPPSRSSPHIFQSSFQKQSRPAPSCPTSKPLPVDFDLAPPRNIAESMPDYVPRSRSGNSSRESSDSISRPSSRISIVTRKIANKFRIGGTVSRENSPIRHEGGTACSNHDSSRRSESPADSFASFSSFGSRIASRFAGSSQPRSRSESRSNSRSQSRNTPASSSAEGFYWPPYTPKRIAPLEVQEFLAPLIRTAHPLVDIDDKAKETLIPLASARLTAAQLSEAQQHGISGVYYSGDIMKESISIHTDAEGQYKWSAGDHIGFRYRVIEQLGKGCFGVVLRCRDHKSGRMVAVKVTVKRPDLRAQALIEATILEGLTHGTTKLPMAPGEQVLEKFHIVRHLDHLVFREHMCIVTEILGPSLYEILKRHNFEGLSEASVRYITRQILEALEFLSDNDIIHCDLKPENVLLSDIDQCQIKLIDFGSSCYGKKRMFTYIQSRFYRAPEILLGMPYGSSIDMWSLGCMVPELLLGRPLWPSEDEMDQVALICETIGNPEPSILRTCRRANNFFNVNCQLLRPVCPKSGITRGASKSRPLASLLPPVATEFCANLLQWNPELRMGPTDAIFHDFCLGI